MESTYFLELNRKTDTRFWINNPTFNDLQNAISAGAVNCTTNPAYCSRLINFEPDYIRKIIDEEIRIINDYEILAMNIYRKTVKRICKEFMPMYEKSGGRQGFVTLQDNPARDLDADYTIKRIAENRNVAKNYMAKIPVIESGLKEIEYCVSENIPVCATEIFSIAQAMAACETYSNASVKYGKKPVIFITHISGIFDEYIKKYTKRENIAIDTEIIDQAGISIARKEYGLLKERGFVLLGGGARGTHHFLEMVGGNAHITINWDTAQEIIENNGDIISTVEKQTDNDVIEELKSKLPIFKKCYEPDAVDEKAFADLGPVQLFRNAFLKGWYHLLQEIATRKHLFAI